MSEVLTGLLVAVVAGFFGILGAVITAKREHRRWKRDARLTASRDFLAAFETITTNATQVRLVRELEHGWPEQFGEPMGWQEAHALFDRHGGAWERLTAAYVALTLVATAEVAAEAERLYELASTYLQEDWPGRKELLVAREAFVQQARLALDAAE